MNKSIDKHVKSGYNTSEVRQRTYRTSDLRKGVRIMKMNELKEQEVNRVKRMILVEAAAIASIVKELKKGDELVTYINYREGQYDELVLLLNLIYDVPQDKTRDVIDRATTQGLGRIDYNLIFFEMGIK